MGLIEIVKDYFVSEDWEIESDEDSVYVRFEGENGRWECLARVREDEQQVLVYSLCPNKVPQERRADMAEFLTRANSGLMVGNFEMDFEDGEVLYKTSLDVEGAVLTQALMRPLVYHNLAVMDRYLPGILGVLFGKISPKEAIAASERDQPAA